MLQITMLVFVKEKGIYCPNVEESKILPLSFSYYRCASACCDAPWLAEQPVPAGYCAGFREWFTSAGIGFWFYFVI